MQGRGVRHMDAAARDFVAERGCELVELGLYRCPPSPPSPATCRNCFLHLAALQQEGVITEAALLLAMVGLQQALVARGATLPHPRLRPGTDCDFGDTSLIEGEETQGLESFSN